jgi:hypothetical protein
MVTRIIALGVGIAIMVCAATLYADEDPCSVNAAPFRGYWWGSRLQVHQHVAGIPLIFMGRFSYREIRHSQCLLDMPLLPPAVGEASISLGIPIINNRRGGWMLGMAAQGQGSQKPGEPIGGLVTGAPATSGHLNFWGTTIPLIQFTGAISSAILPDARDFPLSIAYLGGLRVYPLYRKHAQTNLGFTIGGSNSTVNFIPSFSLRASDFVLFDRRIAIGVEFRTPISLVPGPLPYQWRFWGGLTLAIDELDDERSEQSRRQATPRQSFDLVRSAPEAAPPTQTTWETPL